MVSSGVATVRIICQFGSENEPSLIAYFIRLFDMGALMQLRRLPTTAEMDPIAALPDPAVESGYNAVMKNNLPPNGFPVRLPHFPSVNGLAATAALARRKVRGAGSARTSFRPTPND
jgi:hypothetical protein